ncbi:TPA: Gfo/Idh/MocA family oxidoreductase [bacterium]|nr:Gfo/Idh/MocA family oxidoreductase [bacterium]
MNKIKVVLVGCGGMSGAWLGVAKNMPEVEIVGMVDILEDNAKRRAQDFGIKDAVIGTDMNAVLDKTNPDVIFNCTIPEAHYQVTMDGLNHGCHVFSEKPLADSMEHAQEMVETAEKVGKIFAVIQNRRYDPNIRRLRNFLESGKIGKITTVNCDFYIGAHFGGFRDHMEHVLLLDMAIHTFDSARFIIGADPVSVYCKEWNPYGSWYDRDASAIAIYEMTDNSVYTYRGSWCSEGLNTTWESDWRIIGDKGSVKWDGGGNMQAQVVAEKGGFFSKWENIEIPPYDAGAKVGGHDGLIKEFIRCVQTGETPETVGSDNIKSLAMVFGAIESAKQRKAVDIWYGGK